MKYGDWIGRREFEEKILKSKDSKVAVFAAKWCGFCLRFLSVMREYEPINEKTEISLVDADSEEGQLWDEYHINVVPTIIVFKNGQQLFRRDGVSGAGLTRMDLQDALKTAVS